ncbi:MAG: hypothetical protein ABJA81_10580 [Nocardioidaceae bacterium]
MGSGQTLLVAAIVVAAALVLVWMVFSRRDLGTSADRTTFRTLHTASLASPPLRQGLTPASADKSLRYLRALLGAPAAALTDLEAVLGWDGSGEHHLARHTSWRSTPSAPARPRQLRSRARSRTARCVTS